MAEKKLIVVAGPTAVGKTAVAVRLAEVFKTGVVSADSRQFYRELTIGTAKPTADERRQVPHYFIDNLSIAQDYDAATYAEEVLELIHRLFQRDDYVILCGGSGLYIRAVCDGFDEMPDVPDALRRELTEQYETHGLAWLQEQMRTHDPETLAHLDASNPHRLIRALEVKRASGRSIREFRTEKRREHSFTIVKIGLTLPREVLYARIDERMDAMIAGGLFEEAESLYPFREKNALQTVGYQEIFAMMEGAYDRAECIRLLKRNSRRYAKRQLTWFGRDAGFTWFSPEEVEKMIDHIRAYNGAPER